MSQAKARYGIDIGGTKIELAIFDENYELQDRWRQSTPKQDPQQFIDAITGMVAQADQRSGCKGTLGIGLPGFCDADGKVVSSTIPGINGRPLKADISASLDRKVGFENDVKSFVISESNQGAASGYDYALGLILGTGLAGGQVIRGRMNYGMQSIAGEYGHISIPARIMSKYDFPLRACACGGVGCAEQYLSGPGLTWMCEHFGSDYLSVPDLIQGLEQDDKQARVIFDAYIDSLGCYFAGLMVSFDPQVVVLGGGLSNVKQIYQELPNAINRYVFKGVKAPHIIAAKYGDSSGVRGAAIVGYRESIDRIEHNL